MAASIHLFVGGFGTGSSAIAQHFARLACPGLPEFDTAGAGASQARGGCDRFLRQSRVPSEYLRGALLPRGDLAATARALAEIGVAADRQEPAGCCRSEEHTSELQS